MPKYLEINNNEISTLLFAINTRLYALKGYGLNEQKMLTSIAKRLQDLRDN